MDAARPRRRQLLELGDASSRRAPARARAGARTPRPSPARRAARGGTARPRRRRRTRARRGSRAGRGRAAGSARAAPCRSPSPEPLAGQPLELAVDEADVEARVVRDERRVARERREAPQRGRDPRRAAAAASSERPVSRPIGAGSGTPGATSVSNVSPSSSPRTRTAPISQIRAEATASPVVSRSKTTNAAVLERRRRRARRARRTTRARRAGRPRRRAARAATAPCPRGSLAGRRTDAAPPRPPAPARRAPPRARPAGRANRTPAARSAAYTNIRSHSPLKSRTVLDDNLGDPPSKRGRPSPPQSKISPLSTSRAPSPAFPQPPSRCCASARTRTPPSTSSRTCSPATRCSPAACCGSRTRPSTTAAPR